jgi:tetratricopeptide (TPR) repeat protein
MSNVFSSTPATYLEVLLLGSAPVDLRPLNLVEEIGNFKAQVLNSPIPISLKYVFPPTFEQLRDELSPNRLRLRRPRVFHFMGHGEEDGLWFEKEDGSKDLIKTFQLRELFKNARIDLALLNACSSSTSRVASLCEQLHQDGAVRTAIGHGDTVDDKSAMVFAKQFYAEITRGMPVIKAFQSARDAVRKIDRPGADGIKVHGEEALPLGDDLTLGERNGRVDDRMPERYCVPADRKFFCGRAAEFLEVARTLGDSNSVAFAVWGLGGLGKTALLREVARRNAWRYTGGGVAWVDARQVSPLSAIGLMSVALSSQLDRTASGIEPGAGLRAHFMRKGPGLIVLDNLEALSDRTEHEALAHLVDGIPRDGSRVLLAARTPIEPIEKLSDERHLTLTTGLDEDAGARYTEHVARTKGIKALQDDPALCARVSRRLSGHPMMILHVVVMARKGREFLADALGRLGRLGGDPQSLLEDLLATNLALVSEEGRRLLTYLPLFPTGRFMPEAMTAVCEAILRMEDTDAEGDESATEADPLSWVTAGLRQLEGSAFLDFDQVTKVYTFHQTVLDYVQGSGGLPPEQHDAGLMGLLLFYERYLRDNHENFPAIDRCIGEAQSLMEEIWKKDFNSERLPYIYSMNKALEAYSVERGHWRRAVLWHETFIEHFRGSPQSKERDTVLARELDSYGTLLSKQGERQAARAALTECVQLAEQLRDYEILVSALIELGKLEAGQWNAVGAQDYYRRASRILETLKEKGQWGDSGLAQLQLFMALFAWAQDNNSEARQLLLQAKAIFESAGDRGNLALALCLLARIEQDENHLPEARSLLERAKDLYESVSDYQGRTETLHQLALVARSESRLAEARSLIREIREFYEWKNNQEGLASSLHQLALFERAEGNPTEARRLLRQAIDIKKTLEERGGLATLLNELGFTELLQGELDEARRLATQSMEISQRLEDRGIDSRDFMWLGRKAWEQEDRILFGKASLLQTLAFMWERRSSEHAETMRWVEDLVRNKCLSYDEVSLKVFARIGSQQRVAASGSVHGGEGALYTAKGDLDRAIADLSEVVRVDPQNEEARQHLASLYNHRGVEFGDKEDYDRAIADLSEAVRLDPQNEGFRKHLAIVYNHRGVGYGNKEEYDRAIADFSEAVRLGPQDEVFKNNLAIAYHDRGVGYSEKGDYDRAIADFSEGVRLDPQNEEFRKHLAITFKKRGDALLTEGHLDRAAADFSEAIRLGLVDEEVRKILEACNELIRISRELAERQKERVDKDCEKAIAETAVEARRWISTNSFHPMIKTYRLRRGVRQDWCGPCLVRSVPG